MKRAVERERKEWAKRAAVHSVYMSFTRREVWVCEFFEEPARKLIRRLTVETPEKVRVIAERGGAFSNLESKQMLDYGVASGRGGVTLKLTPEQFANLKSGGSR